MARIPTCLLFLSVLTTPTTPTTSTSTASPSSTMKIREVEYNEICNGENTKCITPNATCENNRCKCLESSFFHSKMRACRKEPEALEDKERMITNITESSITVLLKPAARKQCDKYLLQISPLHAGVVTPVELPRNATNLSHNFTGLNESTMYTISISVIAGNWSNNETTSLSSYTLPKKINRTDILEQGTTFLKIRVYYDGHNSDKITYAIKLLDSQNKTITHTECGGETTENKYITSLNKTTFNITNLKSGKKYKMQIFSCIDSKSSVNFFPIDTYTKINYRASCIETETDSFCLTKNASCINETCCCNSSRQYVHNQDTCVLRPVLPPNSSFEIQEIQYNQFKVNLTVELAHGFIVKISPKNTANKTTFLTTSENNEELIINNLISGTLYTAEISLESNNITSEKTWTRKIYTKPEALEGNERRITNITENSITVLLEPAADKQCDKYLLQISRLHAGVVTPVVLLRNATNLSHNFTGLNDSSNYTISISVIAGNWSNNKTTPLSSYTLPKKINRTDILEHGTTFLKISVYYDGHNSDKITYAIKVMDSQNKTIIHTECGGETTENKNITSLDKTTFNITNLSSGTKYKMQIFSCIYSESSVNFFPIDTFTRPLPPQNGRIYNVTENSFKVHWDNGELSYTSVRLFVKPYDQTEICNYSCGKDSCYKNHSNECSFEVRNKKQDVEVIGLTAGTKYEVNIYSYIEGLKSETSFPMLSYTVPLLPAQIFAPLDKRQNNSFVIQIKDPNPKFKWWIVEVSNDSTVITKRNQSYECVDMLFDNSTIKPGTPYNVSITTEVPGFTSNSKNVSTVYTRPDDIQSVSIPRQLVHETNFTISYKTLDQNYDEIEIRICPCNYSLICNNTVCNNTIIKYNGDNLTSLAENLTVSTFYNVFVRTALNSTTSRLTSSNFKIASSYTAPEKPTASLQYSDFTSVTLNLTGNEKKQFDNYTIDYQNPLHNISVPGANKSAKIEDLIPGTSYTFRVFAVLTEIISDQYKHVTTYTRPSNVTNMSVFNTTNESMTVQWVSPSIGNVDTYKVLFLCKSPNGVSSKGNYTGSLLSYDVKGLEPGTSCKANMTTSVGGIDGISSIDGISNVFVLEKTTDEMAPGNVTIEHNETDRNTIYLSWKKPVMPNGVIRKYQLVVKDIYHNCSKWKYIYSNCSSGSCNFESPTDCKDADTIDNSELCSDGKPEESPNRLTLSQNVTDLRSFWNYSIEIQAFTKCWGESIFTYLQTKTDIPSAAPIQNLTSTKNTITVKWDELSKEDRNGEITSYNINYTTNDKKCSLDVNGKIKQITTNVPGEMLEKILPGLRPFWYYNISMSASTSAGEGKSTEIIEVQTKESEPGRIEHVYIKNESTNSAIVNWTLPCELNGVLTKFTINMTNAHPFLSWLNPTSPHITEQVLKNLRPYSNYTVRIAASTKVGRGNYSEGVKFRTKIGKPRELRNLLVEAVNATSLNISWNTPDLYTGPTKYTVIIQDAVDSSIPETTCETGIDFYRTNCIKTGLDEFWNYTIHVVATAGSYSTPTVTKFGQTEESEPGHVSNLTLKSENDVTKQRSVNVTWNEPSIRDRNGIIQNYSIVFTNSNNAPICFVTDSSTRYCTYNGLFPGNYSVEVFANTSAGNGPVVMKTVYVQPGAPLRINESEGGPLMAPSADQPKDTERQMAVNLPLKTFLCNTSNGYPTKWGVIVAQNDQATDEPFFGSVRDFTDRISKVYKTWFDVKDMDSIKPYLATYLNLTDSCQHINDVVTQTEHSTVMSHNIYKSCKPCLNSMELLSFPGTRKRRSVTQRDVETYQRFVVGLDGKCSGKQTDRFCNGELQPGRSYRVKTFACTIKGCTETKYSKPISTDPDLTVAVASGISSAIVVLAIVGVVVFLLRRKQLACFSKDDGRLVTDSPDEGIHLDKIEHTKKNPSSTPGQGPVKLSDFSDAVERFHKDSDLLFADAYKVLKEKSPSHPMTAAEQQCCRPKNRYTNILPFDHSRVKLRPSDDMEGSDYINANYIPGYKSRREYIATQGPMQATFDDFWRMVWEQNVDTIVMLTKLMEKGRRKCDKYWPDMGEPVFYGDLVVSLQSESNMSDYIIKIFEVKTKTQRKMVRHFSYLKWPDMGCPETPELLLEFVKAVKQYSNREQQPSSNGPMIVHCSAGVGRTGTFIAVDYLLQHIKDHDEVDIFNLVLEMRNNRLNMVQTEDQYIYIHECIKSFITTQQEEEEQEDDDDEAIYVNTGFGADEENLYANT